MALLPFLSEVTGQEVTGWNDIPMDVLTQVRCTLPGCQHLPWGTGQL